MNWFIKSELKRFCSSVLVINLAQTYFATEINYKISNIHAHTHTYLKKISEIHSKHRVVEKIVSVEMMDWRGHRKYKIFWGYHNPKAPLAGSRLRNQLSCRHILAFLKKNTQRAEPRAQRTELRTSRKFPQMNFKAIISFLPSFPLFLNQMSTMVIAFVSPIT